MCGKFWFSTIIYAEVMFKNWFSTGKPLVPGLKLLEQKKWLNSVRKPTNSSALCAELLGKSKAPKRVVHFIFLSPVAISAMLLERSVENVQRRATKLILKPSFRCDVTYKTRPQLTNLLPISFWHEFLDIVFFYKAINTLVFKDSEALPATRQSTRSIGSSSINAITYISKRSRTVTYQRSFFIRARRTWNVLPAELCTSHISLASFKRSLFQY